MQPESFYEIELKALLNEEKYKELYSELPRKMKLITDETITTTRYRPGDIRLRHSNKTLEIICKDGDPTKICRKEVRIPLQSKEQLNHFGEVFFLLGLKSDPSWTKTKQEYEHFFNGYNYVVCLQNIHNFAYLLEVEYLSKDDDSHIHEPNLRKIAKELGCEPIEPKEFNLKIDEYIKKNRTK